MLEVERYYRILDLEPGASPEEVHQGYLDMTWVWHPDRFVGHPRLKQKAHHKLQELNEAHERLRSCQPTRLSRDLHPKWTSQTSPPSDNPSSSPGLSKPQANRAGMRDNKQTVKNVKPPISVKTSKLDDWLD
ncbi:MAG TPA: hypothetical protein DDZ80_30230 [Cyanobacteria bacterium UBA8803]|nr:hypothetical protein [Cyanobacteria bacterium UBA9273]HBL62512.1 hypothetical protein [Cyanobacteria bacterium UBA8803]